MSQEGDLSTYLKQRGGQYLDEEEVMLKFVQICLALQAVHSKARLSGLSVLSAAYCTIVVVAAEVS